MTVGSNYNVTKLPNGNFAVAVNNGNMGAAQLTPKQYKDFVKMQDQPSADSVAFKGDAPEQEKKSGGSGWLIAGGVAVLALGVIFRKNLAKLVGLGKEAAETVPTAVKNEVTEVAENAAGAVEKEVTETVTNLGSNKTMIDRADGTSEIVPTKNSIEIAGDASKAEAAKYGVHPKTSTPSAETPVKPSAKMKAAKANPKDAK